MPIVVIHEAEYICMYICKKEDISFEKSSYRLL